MLRLDSYPRRGILAAMVSMLLVACAPEHDAAAVPPDPLRHEGDKVVVPLQSPLRKAIQVAPALLGSIQQPFVVPSSVEADPSKLVKILPPVAGRIVALDKRLGDAVKAGDVLFTMDSSDLAQAYSDYNKAQSQLVLSRRNWLRQEDLGRDQIAARKDIEAAENDYALAQSEARRATLRLEQLGVPVTADKTGGRIYRLKSPISGRIVDINSAQGGYWNDTNAAIMTVADLSHVWLTASVQEKDLPKVYVGQTVHLRLNAFPDEPHEGRVSYVGEILDPDTRTVKVRIALDNEDGRFKPGMFARAEFFGRAYEGIVVPTSALVQSGTRTLVFVEVSPWQFQAREVRTGAQLDTTTVILSGLRAGERVVTKEGVVLND